MLFATQKTYFRRQRQRGGERFDVDSIADTGINPFSYSHSCSYQRERSHREASRLCSFSHLSRTASAKGPHRHRWPRSNVHRRVQVKYSPTNQLGVDRNASKT